MKKKLIAGALGLSAASVFAQSSVTLFGSVDISLAHGRGGTADRTSLLSSGDTSSKLGVRGVEDLGGGLAANFWLEAGVNPDHGTGTATSSNNQVVTGAVTGSQGLVFNRRSTVGLSGGWGEVRLGRDLTPSYLNIGRGDPFSHLGVGISLNAQGTNVGGPTWVRASNSISYLTPSTLGGFFGHVMGYLGENASNSPDSNAGNGGSIRVGYESALFTISAAHGKNNLPTGDAIQQGLLFLGNFAGFRLFVTLHRDRIDGPSPDGESWSVGLNRSFGPHLVRGSISSYEFDSPTSPRSRKLALGYVYNLSKRSALYTTAAHVRNSGGANIALGGAITGANQSSSAVEFGIRHHF